MWQEVETFPSLLVIRRIIPNINALTLNLPAAMSELSLIEACFKIVQIDARYTLIATVD